MAETTCERCSGTGNLYVEPGPRSHGGRVETCPDCNTEAKRLARVLQEHWLVSTGCDHEARTNTPQCACSLVAFPAFPSVGAAVEAWAHHVLEVAGYE